MSLPTLRPHEVLCEIIDRIEDIPKNVIKEILSESPRGFACSAALKHIRGIVLVIDRLDAKYDGSIGLLDPSKIAAGEGLDIGDDNESSKNTESEAVDAVDEDPFRPFFGNPLFLIKPIGNLPRSKQVFSGSNN